MSAFEGQQPPVDGVDEYEQDEVDKVSKGFQSICY